MTYNGFIEMLEECWGAYGSESYKNLMLKWVSENFKEDALPYLFQRIFKGYSRQFKNCPDAKIISDIVSEIKKDAENYSDIPQIEKSKEQKLITEEKPTNEQMKTVAGMLNDFQETLKKKREKEASKKLK